MKKLARYILSSLLLIVASSVVTANAQTDVITAYSLDASSEPRDTVARRESIDMQKARSAVNSTKVIFVNSGDGIQVSNDSVMKTISTYYLNQYRHFQDPLAPFFMFMSKDATMAMGLGGVIRMRGWFGWNSVIVANGMTPENIPVPRDPAMTRRLAATASGTGIFLTILGRNTAIGNYMGYFEASFDGYDNLSWSLQKAYFTLNDWTAGYATSTFSDPAAQPPTIDNQGPCGKYDRSNILVRYMRCLGKRNEWIVGGSFEFPNSRITDEDRLTEKRPDYLPDLVASAQYQWDETMSHIRLSGIMRFLPYRDLVAQKNHTIMGWGLQLSGFVNVTDPLTLYGIVAGGRGNASYASDMGRREIDLIPDPSTPGRLKTPGMLGITAGAKYAFTRKVWGALAFSRLNYYPGKDAETTEYKNGTYGAASLFWDITPRVQVSGGYIYARRGNVSGLHASASRIETMFSLSF